MNTATPPSSNGSTDPSGTPHHRRSREEVEALAKNFVATPVEDVAPVIVIKRPPRMALAAGVGAVVVIALAVGLWPAGKGEPEPARPAESSRASAEAEQWRQRLEAERERKRKELASGKEYLERMAAADAALVKDMGEQAARLAQRAAPAPAGADAPPTPRESTRTASAPSQPAPAPSQPASASSAAASAPAKAAPAEQETAKAAPAESATQAVAQVDKASCSIHVSELSKSGKLTYADVKRMKGARLDDGTGNVFTPPVQVAGRNVVFEVMPTGCVRMVRR